MKRFGIFILLLSLLPTGSFAYQPNRRIDAIQQIGTSRFQMVESKGQIFFMDDTGRYVIKGRLYDMWDNKAELRSIAELKQASTHLNIDKIGMDVEDLLHVSYGSGPETVYIWVSPNYPGCHATLKQMKSLGDEYTFKILPVPAFEDQAGNDAVQRINSNYKSHPEQTLEAIINNDYSTLELKEGVNIEPMQRNIIASRILGISSVPGIIGPDGYFSMGQPQSLAERLKQ